MKTVNVHARDLCWPSKCPVCGEQAAKRLAVKTSRLTGAVPVGPAVLVTGKVTTIHHPICSRHFLVDWLASGMSQKSRFYLALGFLSVLCVISIAAAICRMLSGQPDVEFGAFGWISLAFPSVYWALYFRARRNTPVRLASAANGDLVFVFQNANYADEFSRENAHQQR